MPEQKSKERRRYVRSLWQETVLVTSPDKTDQLAETMHAEDISERGIRLYSADPHAPGNVLILGIPIAGSSVKIQSPAYVRWCVPSPLGGHVCGLEFII